MSEAVNRWLAETHQRITGPIADWPAQDQAAAERGARALAEIAAEQDTSPYGNRLSPNMYWPAPETSASGSTSRTEAQRLAATDTSAYDQQRLAGLIAELEQAQRDTEVADNEADVESQLDRIARDRNHYGYDLQRDPQWAGPSLPHPSEATSPEERAELDQGWDDWEHSIEPNTNAEEAQI